MFGVHGDFLTIATNGYQSDSALVLSFFWFAYDVIKSMIMQFVINVPQILIWPRTPYKLSLYRI